MIKTLSVTIALSIMLCMVGCEESSVVDSSGGLDKSVAREYEVFGMDCPGCQSGLEKLVNKIPEVAESDSSWQAKRLWITPVEGAELNDEDVFDAISRGNFTAGKRIK